MAYPIPQKDVKKGDINESVKWLQDALNNCGAPQAVLGRTLSLDGKAGANTDKAIRIFQEAWHLSVDGVVGPKTRTALADSAVDKREKLCRWAAYCGRYLVRHSWRYEGGSFGRAKSWYAAVKNGRKQASCAAFVSWVCQLAGVVDMGKEISHTPAGYGIGPKAVKYAENIHGGVFSYPNQPVERCNLKPGDVVWYDSNICLYAGDGKWWDAGGPFAANCDKTAKGKNRYIAIPSAPAYDRKQPVLAVYRMKKEETT